MGAIFENGQREIVIGDLLNFVECALDAHDKMLAVCPVQNPTRGKVLGPHDDCQVCRVKASGSCARALIAGYHLAKDIRSALGAAIMTATPVDNAANTRAAAEQQRIPEGMVLVPREALEWIAMFAEMRSADSQRVAAKVQRSAMKNIAERTRAMLSALQPHEVKP